LLRQLGVPAGAPVLLGGSTHAGEEAILADQFLCLRERFPDLFLVLVPRHFERGREVGRELKARGVPFAYRNEVTNGVQYGPSEIQCLLVNTTGELKFFYEYASVIFIGKSLTAEGGQNPIEPGALGKPMVFGPNMQNFADVVRSFLARGGAIQVRTAAELEQALGELLANPARCEKLGRSAQAVVEENLGAINRTAAMIIEHLDNGEIYVAP
jgi:3-deoxy-D-manno-octulosonic-acid transferase